MGRSVRGYWMSFAALGCVLAWHVAAVQAQDTVPVIRTARSGPWSAVTTWEGGKVPDSGVKVQIREGHTVVYDAHPDNVIRSLHVHGILTFATDRDTRLDVGLIRVLPGDNTDEEGFDCNHPIKPKDEKTKGPTALPPGFTAPCLCCDGKASLLIGTPEHPVAAKHTALIRLHYIEGMKKESCPAILCCGGRLDFHGAAMNRTWARFGANANAGEDRVVLDTAVTGWKPGDRVVITGSSGNFGAQSPQTEERKIIALDGARLTLDRPLAYSHSGTGDFRAEVGNLSRNVIVESANPDGVRGHTMFHSHSAGSISYAEFRHLGKRGILGRYPIHFHLCRDTMRGSYVIGASIWDSHNRLLTIHGSEYLVVRDCVGYKSLGHGFFLEDGTEVYNVFDRNLAVAAQNGEPQTGQALPFDKNEGAGFWWANSHNTFTRNVAADCAGYGFRYEATPKAGFKDGDRLFGSPNHPFDLTLPVLRPDGSRTRVDIRTLPFIRFDGNTAHNIANYGVNLGQEAGGVGPDKDHPFMIRDLTIWNAQRNYTVGVPHVRIDGMQIGQGGYEIYRGRYLAQDYRNVRLWFWGRILISNRDEYLASGKATGKKIYEGGGLNRVRLPGFPRGLGAGGASYQDPEIETAILEPVDDLPPITVITHVRKEGDRRIIRGTTSDNGTVKKVLVNGTEARSLAPNFTEWEAVLSGTGVGPLDLSAHAEDGMGNVESRKHQLRGLRCK